VLNALREFQVPLLAILLIGGCAAKARRAIAARSVEAGISPTSMFPLHLRRPAAIALCATELSLGVALVVTAGTIGAGTPAMVTRGATALLFLTAVGALNELRSRRPDAGCGCFGDLSHTPVSWRTLARSALLSLAALAAITAPPLREPSSPGAAWVLLAMVAAELAVLAAVSPEIGEIMVRLGYYEPCEVRRLPVSRTLASLRGSSQWRRYRRHLLATEPADVWREGCWRYAVFPGMTDGRPVDIVFAVYLQARRPPVRAAIVDGRTEENVPSVTIPIQRGVNAPYPKRVFVPAPPTDLYRSIKESQY
jgi:hypothetical protein